MNLLYSFIFYLLLTGCATKKDLPHPPLKQFQHYDLAIAKEEKQRADEVFEVANCPLTPTVAHDVKIPAIYKTNNLRKKTGYATYAEGQFIRINGIVTDRNCVPVRNATIQMWHADAKGRYKNLSEGGYLNDSLLYTISKDRFQKFYPETITADENFTGGGTTVTDNLGRFTFLTVLPGSIKGKVPFANLRILCNGFEELNTVVYFEKTSGIAPELVAVKEGFLENDGIKEVIYSHTLTLNGKNKYLSY